MQNVVVTVGEPRKFDYSSENFANDEDTNGTIYDFTGSGLSVSCLQSAGLEGRNCNSNPYVNAPGTCYPMKGNLGYRCSFRGIPDRSQYQVNLPPPTTF